MKIIILFFTELQVSILQSVYLKTLDKTFLFSIKKTVHSGCFLYYGYFHNLSPLIFKIT